MSTPTAQRPTDADPFNITPESANRERSKSLRHSQLDSRLLASFARGSPSQAKRALEAHIVDTDRRIHDASKLGTTLLDQKKQLAERLKDLDAQQGDEEINSDLKHKLAELEKEYNEVGKETARAFIPKGKRTSLDFGGVETERTPLADKGTGANTDKRPRPDSIEVTAGKPNSRKSRNQPQNRVHDIEFATEISTSLLGQVRGLQNLLAEKEVALKETQKDNARLQSDLDSLAYRARGLDDAEEKFKDENWNLETQVQDLTAVIKESAIREEKLQQALNATKHEKSSTEREYEELRSQHNKLTDDHSALRRTHDANVADLKRNLEGGYTERDEMQKRIDELFSQNQDLAKAVAYRAKAERETEQPQIGEDDVVESIETPENSPPVSPTKATPHHGALESETLKSSLTHAHRMIQNLKNNIHREKTEKIELKRMLQDARDEIEQQKVGGGAAGANAGRKRKPVPGQNGRSGQPSKLGGARDTNEWEEYDDDPVGDATRARAADLTTDASDAFETADERHTDTQTETEAAFESAQDTMAGSSDDDLTETEDNFTRSVSTSTSRPPAHHRDSFASTASDEGDAFDLTTPIRQPKYKLKLNRGGVRRSETPMRDSPASFVSNQSLPRSGFNLASELEGMDNASSAATSRQGTMERSPEPGAIMSMTPDLQRRDTKVLSPIPMLAPKPAYVDSSMLTEPWEPEPKHITHYVEVPAAPAPSVGTTANALTFERSMEDEQQPATQMSEQIKAPAPLQISGISSQSTAPLAPPNQEMPTFTSIGTNARTPDAKRTADIPAESTRAVGVAPTEDFIPPETPSIGRDNKLAPDTQQFLNDILAQARMKRGESVTSSGANAKDGDTFKETTPRGQTSTAQRDRSPSFTISIPGRDLKRPANADPMTPEERTTNEPPLRIHKSPRREDGSFDEPTLSLDDPYNEVARSPSQYDLGLSPSYNRVSNRDSGALPPEPAKAMVTASTQTSLAGEQVDSLIKDSKRRSAQTSLNASPVMRNSPTVPGGRAMSMGTSTDPALLKTLNKRPSSSAGPARNGTASPVPGVELPPLPADHREVIAEAKNRSSSLLSMPPPNFSVPKLQPAGQPRDRTSSGTFGQSPLRHQTQTRNRTSSMAAGSVVSRRSSVSSFASEVDERFQLTMPAGLAAYREIPGASTADPRMIQAITQTMIGEFLWKYTRKAGRGDSHSENRHRRFFWIHPYTRTLYWSNQDPSVAGRSELKAKSVAIEAVRVIGDDNPIPPGLCNKSIVVVTPGRSIKFTAPTQRRHETWFNALSYLLVRSGAERDDDVVNHANNYTNTSSSLNNRSNTMSSAQLTAEDVAEFNPDNYSRTASRFSHRSMSSIGTNGRKSAAGGTIAAQTTPVRTSSPQGRSPAGSASNSLAIRQSQAAQKRDRQSAGPLSANPVQSIPESDASRRGSQADMLTGDRPVTAEMPPQPEIDADGFKKPMRPMSTASKRESSSKDGSLESPAANKAGRLSSLTSRISRASFANLGRSRKSTKSEAELMKEANGVTGGAGGGNETRGADGHEHQYVFTRNADGTLENVRACCDGKHDLSSLRHRSESRTSLGRRRSQSRGGEGGKRMSFSQRVAPRPIGGT